MCNGISPNAAYDAPTAREKELIQKLEEATGEIEALLIENEKLMALSNELRFEVQQTRESRHAPPTRDGEETEETNEYEQAMLAAILNDQSRSCDSESHESEVACIGRKPPLTSAVECRRSKNASVRIYWIYCSILVQSLFSLSCLSNAGPTLFFNLHVRQGHPAENRFRSCNCQPTTILPEAPKSKEKGDFSGKNADKELERERSHDESIPEDLMPCKPTYV